MRCLRIAALGLLCWIGGCASPLEQAYFPPDAPPAVDGQRFVTGNHAVLPLRSWLPEGKPSAVLIALHGFNDYSNAFALPGAWLARHGVAVYAYDQRGFGAGGSRGIWAGRNNLVSDMKQIIAAIRPRNPGARVFLLGESMGGAVLLAAQADPDFPADDVAGLILSAPAVWGEDTLNPLYRLTLWIAAHSFPAMEFTGRDLGIQATDNLAVLREMARDPNILKTTRADAVYGMVGLMDAAYACSDKIRLPVLLLYGQKDQVIPLSPVRQVAEKCLRGPRHPCRAVYYPNGYHMLLRDLEAQAVWRDIARWIADQLADPPYGHAAEWEVE